MTLKVRSTIATVAAILVPIYAWGCGNHLKLEAADRSWVHSSTVLYGFKLHGLFFRTRPGSNKTETITDHHFSDAAEVAVSPDKHYLLYYGRVGEGDSPYYLYDLKQGVEKILPDLKQGHAVPAFSPNSDTILLWTYDEKRNQDLFLFSIASFKATEIPFPEDAGQKSYFGGFWSLDGKSIYVVTMVGKDTDQHYYRYDVDSGAYTKITGHPINNGNVAVFIDQGREVPTLDMFGPCSEESRCGEFKLESPNGHLLASIDNQHHLVISGAETKETVVDAGGYDECEGGYVHLNGWLDDNYLVYHLHSIPYIYDVRTGRKSVLFDRQTVTDFFW